MYIRRRPAGGFAHPGRSEAISTLPRWALISILLVPACRDTPDQGSAPPARSAPDLERTQPRSLQYGLQGRFARRCERRQGEPHPAGIGDPRVQHESAIPERCIHRRRLGFDGGGDHQPEAHTAGSLHAVHFEWGGCAVCGEDRSDQIEVSRVSDSPAPPVLPESLVPVGAGKDVSGQGA